MKKLPKRIHILGIGGISLSALALILKDRGHIVTGSDKIASGLTKKLETQGINVCINGLSKDIKGAELIVVTAAIGEDDKELVLAKKLGKKIISRAQLLGMIASTFDKVISVAGSHGKTTTTAMISKIFINANKNPTIHIGGELDIIDGNVLVGSRNIFITEACEYVDSFLELKSDVSVILNIQSDHLDYFKIFKNIDKSFTKFAGNTKKGGLVVYSGEDVASNKKYRERSVSFSLDGKGILQARNIKQYEKGKYKFDLCFLHAKLCNIKLGVYGKHNIYNALASIAVALEFGIDIKNIKKSLLEFKGVKRRFEDYGKINGVKVIHDYAHHPTEIKATISSAIQITKGNLYVVFQPHTYSRTAMLLNEFLTCFKGAKEILVYKVYPAREKPKDGIDEKALARALSLNKEKAFSFDMFEDMNDYLKIKMKEGDSLLILGAGDIEKFAKYYINNN